MTATMDDDLLAGFRKRMGSLLEPPTYAITDDLRAHATRLCREQAKHERGERGRLEPPPSILAEGPAEAYDLSMRCAAKVGENLLAGGYGWTGDTPWEAAGDLLAQGWKPGDAIKSMVLGRGPAS